MKKLLCVLLCVASALCAMGPGDGKRLSSQQIEKEGPAIKAAQEAFLKGEDEKFDQLVKEHKNGSFFMKGMSVLLFSPDCKAQGVNKLASIGCDVNVKSEFLDGMTPLVVAAAHADKDKVEALLAHNAVVVNDAKNGGVTAAHGLVGCLLNDDHDVQKVCDMLVRLKTRAAEQGVDIMQVRDTKVTGLTAKELLLILHEGVCDQKNIRYDKAIADRYDVFVKTLQAKGML